MSVLGALDWKTLCKHVFYSFFKTKNTQFRISKRRALVLSIFIILFPLLLFFTRLCFILDDIFFPGYRRQEVGKPVFIIGNFRSGSTLMFRLLARDTRNFRAYKTWEIYTAPSICQKKLVRGLRMADDLLGGPLQHILYSWEKKNLKGVSIHKIGIHKYEEDVALLLHIWSGFFTWFLFPHLDGVPAYDRFDTRIPLPKRNRILGFYESCVKRQLYARGRDRIFLSKNPSFSPMVESLARKFPDARFIYLVRNPVRMVPSETSWFSFAWHYFTSPGEQFPNKDFTLDIMGHWYRYPVRWLERNLPPERYMILRYEDIMPDITGTVRAIYNHFGISLNAEFKAILAAEEMKHRGFTSSHEYSLEDQGYDRREVMEALKDVFTRFGYDPDSFDTDSDTGYSNGEI